MAFDEYLPKNSESRCFAIAIKMIKKNTPHIKWVISFSDATQCGDGAIYRASGFYLTAIRESKIFVKIFGSVILSAVIFVSVNLKNLASRKLNVSLLT